METIKAFQVLSAYAMDGAGDLWLETDCHDYDEFRALPVCLVFKSVRYAKTGWSSDTSRACYSARAVKSLAFPA
jgi:hypothetical protein